MRKRKFILSGGGTGGHIYPAVAIADELKIRFPEAEFLFVGAKDRMEMEKVPEAGYPIEGLWISGLQRKINLKNLMLPIKLITSLWKASGIIKKFKPDAVIGTGGFASGPLLKAATKKGLPTLLQEQNSYAGMTNKWLAKEATKICVAYEHMERYFPKEKIVLTGNPVRSGFSNLEKKRNKALGHFGLQVDKKTLLVLGGSLGARKINELLAREVEFITAQNVQVIWQCGRLYVEQFKDYGQQDGVQVHEFLKEMDLAYAAADFVISRSGALSVSELCLVGKPVIFIPSPNVAEDHQTKNAQALEKQEAAILLPEKELEKDFRTRFKALLDSPEMSKKLGENILKLGKPRATQDIVDEIEKMIN